MDHAQSIALATDLLAEGRAEDVVEMIDPMLEPVDAPVTSTGQLMLRALRARVDVLRRDDTDSALNLLPPLREIGDLCTCVRAEVSLWRGWAHARRHVDSGEAARALRLLEHAEDLFDSIFDASGRCWARLGKAQAYFALDEYGLMRDVLERAESLTEKLNDAQAERWLHELSIPALRFDGRYEQAEGHVDALQALGQSWNDRRVRGYAAAHGAALRHDLGQPPSRVIETAETAEALLRRVDNRAHYPLLAAYHAHVGALLRRGSWDEALTIIDEAEGAVRDDPVDQAHLKTLRVRIALRRDKLSEAKSLLESLVEQVHHLPHGLQRSHVALLHGELLARQNRLDEAYEWIQQAHRNARETGHRGNELRTLLTLARTAAARSDLGTAERHLAAADAYDEYFSVLPFAVRRFAAEGTIAQTADRVDDATQAYRHALSAASMMHDRYRTASLQLALAQLEGDDRAHALASAAQATFETIDADQELEVATALASGTSPAEDAETPASTAYPSSFVSSSSFGTVLAEASLSVPLVCQVCLEAAGTLLPNRWLGVYRVSGDGIPSLVTDRGSRPADVSVPKNLDTDTSNDSVEWLSLRRGTPSFLLAVEQRAGDDARWTRVTSTVRDWLPLVRLALERALLHQRPPEDHRTDISIPVDGFITESEAMRVLVDQIRRLRTSHSPILITGEGGVGKRLLARAVHATSERSDGPLHRVACANMQHEPIAERLFGIEANGTVQSGAVQKAEGGTLLIEDVDALSSTAQTSLLHLLEAGEIVPEKGTQAQPVDVRVLATSTSPLEEEVRDGNFRRALFERLTVLSLHMPPLRERRADIPLLVRHFLKLLRPEGSKMASITQPAMEALLRYDWPGNVRQLRNEVERALAQVSSEPAPTIDRTVLLDTIVEDARSQGPPSTDDPDAILHPDQTLSDVLSRTEASIIKRVLRACDGQVTASADLLGLSRQGLYKKMKRLNIDASNFQSTPDTDPTPTP